MRLSRWVVSAAVVVIALVAAPRLLVGLAIVIPLAALITVRHPPVPVVADAAGSGPASGPAFGGPSSYAAPWAREVAERSLLLPELAFIALVLGPELRSRPSGSLRHSFAAQPVALRVLALVVFGAVLGYVGQRLWRELPWWRRFQRNAVTGAAADTAPSLAPASRPGGSSGHRLGEAIYLGVASIPLFILGTPTYSSAVVALLYLGPLLLAWAAPRWSPKSVHLGLAQRLMVHWAFVVSRPTHGRHPG